MKKSIRALQNLVADTFKLHSLLFSLHNENQNYSVLIVIETSAHLFPLIFQSHFVVLSSFRPNPTPALSSRALGMSSVWQLPSAKSITVTQQPSFTLSLVQNMLISLFAVFSQDIAVGAHCKNVFLLK